MLEIEVKLPIDGVEPVRTRLIELGFERSGCYGEQDVYFDSGSGQIRNSGQALRVRRNIDYDTGGEYAELNFKGVRMDDMTMSRRELETVVRDADVAIEILRALGYEPVEPHVSKTRELYSNGAVNACIDSVEELGVFLELEIVADENEGEEDEIRRECLDRIEAVLHSVGYRMEDTISTSYLGLLMGISY